MVSISRDCEYEFSTEQNAIIQKLVSAMIRSGAALVAMGLVFAAYQVLHYYEPELAADDASLATQLHLVDYALWVLLGLNGVVLGALVFRATRGFALVVRTEGQDVEHLLSALGSLRAIFNLAFWVLLGSTIVLVLSSALLVGVF
jgi:hypothetical protein